MQWDFTDEEHRFQSTLNSMCFNRKINIVDFNAGEEFVSALVKIINNNTEVRNKISQINIAKNKIGDVGA